MFCKQSHWQGALTATLLVLVSGCTTTHPRNQTRRALPFKPAKPTKPNEPSTLYRVQHGDTLDAIASKFATQISDLLRCNRLANPHRLQVGQVLHICRGKPRPVSPHAQLAWPLSKGIITSPFGKRGVNRHHDGLDIGAPLGTPVHVVADGQVIFADFHGSYGNIVIVKHARGLSTVYAHLKRILVREGRNVHRHQVIGLVGATGRATGPHLHFEVREGVEPRNPLLYLPKHL